MEPSRTVSSGITQIKTISLPAIEKRTAQAEKIEKIFTGLKPGQRLVNVNDYIIKLQSIAEAANRDYYILHQPGHKVVNPEVKKAREALDRQIALLNKIGTIAEGFGIIPKTSQKDPSSEWVAELRKAVKNHDHRKAFILRNQIR